MMNMKLFSSLPVLALGLSLVACAPSAYVLDLESRKPSESGLELQGKSLSVIYLESADGRDSLFNNRAADALAYGLESEFFDGAEAVKVYNLVKDEDGDYASRDTASQYIVLLDTDVIMILDTPEITESATGRGSTVASKLYVYDSMAGDTDGVTTLKSTATVSTPVNDVSRAMNIGTALVKPLRSQWEKEMFTVLYFDGLGRKWIDAVMLADEMKWDEAITLWMDLALRKDATQSTCARYDIALGCFMLGQYDLALEWLDSSDAVRPLSLSRGLRKRILEKQGSTSSD